MKKTYVTPETLAVFVDIEHVLTSDSESNALSGKVINSGTGEVVSGGNFGVGDEEDGDADSKGHTLFNWDD